MLFRDLVEPEQFAVLTAALDDICRTAGIQAQTPEYDDTASLLMHLYKNGYRTADQLRTALDPARLEARFG